jgi:hypothetical protein
MPVLQRQGFLAIITGFIGFVLLIGQFPGAEQSWAGNLSAPLSDLLGWGAPVLLVGVILTCAQVVRGAFAGRVRVRGAALWCLGGALVLLLVESRLLFGPPDGGLVGHLGAYALLALATPWRHLVVLGALVVDAGLLLRIAGQAGRQTTHAATHRPEHSVAMDPTMPPLSPEVLGWSSQPTTTTANAHPRTAPLDEIEAILASLPPAPGGTRTVVLPPVHDSRGESGMEALRVPAYLRRGTTAYPLGTFAPLTTNTAEFALPPLPGTYADPPTARLLPQLPAARPQALERAEVAIPREPTSAGREAAYGLSHHPKTRVRGTRTAQWALPSLQLLHAAPESRNGQLREHAERLAEQIAHTLKSFGVEAEVRLADISVGPTIIRFGVRPLERIRKDERGRVMVDANGEPVVVRTRVSRIMNLKDDLALALAVKTLRMEAPVPERPYVGIEIPNVFGRMVTLREMLESREFLEATTHSKLAVALGRDVAGRVRVGDLARFPHLLIAGATGAGKSVALSAIIGSLITQATPDEVRLVLIDPKMVELTLYAGIPHLLTPVITDARRATEALQAAITEMERRYRLFAKLGVRNLDGYEAQRTQPAQEKLPRIVIVIDELADLMMVAAEEIERHICRLAQLARAVGIHLVVATQRPSVDVITGLIKANIPTRIAFMVSSAVDSRVILDHGGAEKLLGKGDMLFLAGDAPKAERIQGAYVADEEVERLAQFWSGQANALGIVPAQWALAGGEDDDEEQFAFAGYANDDDAPLAAWQWSGQGRGNR